MEDPWNSSNTSLREWRLFLYEGDARTDSNSLTLVRVCISLTQVASGVEARVDFFWELKPNTYYTIRILGRTGYASRVRLRLYERGNAPSVGHDPTTLPASHQLGTLAFAPTYTIWDNWSCAARIAQNHCGALTPTDTIGGFDLALYYTFTLAGLTHLYVDAWTPWWWYYCMGDIRFRFFQTILPVDCGGGSFRA